MHHMKKLLVQLIFLALYFPAMSQGWVYVHGTITDIADGFPIPAHAVTIMTDSTNGSFYYNIVYTDSAGVYYDDIPVLSDSSGVIHVQTTDCQDYLHQAVIYFDPDTNLYTRDFQICSSNSQCQAYFYYYQFSGLTYHFIDQSIGNPLTWYWDFGDGGSSTQQFAEHVFDAAGWYTVTLSISNQSTGCYDTYSSLVVVNDSIAGDCHAAFTYYNDTINTPPYNYHFIDESTGNINLWYWSFGDGVTSTEQSPYHTYQQPGTFEVCLHISGADSNCYDYTCYTIVIESNTGCQAYFGYYAYPQGSPDSFHFYDQSTGNIYAWSWNFGDGTGSEEQNPFHTFPGPGTFHVCLTASNNSCSDTFCQDIVISDTIYHQLYGQVYAGNFPLETGTVMLFAMNPNGGYSPFGEPWLVDSNGVYYFTLVPDGNYLILAIPFDSSNFIPTYFGDVINWQEATQVILGVPDNPYNINLVMAGQKSPGQGTVSGQINRAGLRDNEVEKINMIMMNESGTAIGFSKVSASGLFDFQSMDYGTYYMRAELPGVSCENMMIIITIEKPNLEVFLNFSGNSIQGVNETNPVRELISVYPNPARDRLSIILQLTASLKIVVEIFNMTGRLVYDTDESCNAGQNTLLIALNDYPAGIYTLRISSSNGINQVRKILISK
jgi:PKD repeat protein